MQTSRSTRIRNVIIASVIVAIGGRLLGWSLTSIFLALAALTVAFWLYTYWTTWRTLEWYRVYSAYTVRIGRGDTEAVIAELTQRREQGDTSPLTAITLAAAYNYLGRGAEAEPYALEAFDAIMSSDLCSRTDISARARCDLAYLTRCDAMLTQGRFIEAAGGIRARMRDAMQPNFQTALAAWAYFLGGEHDSAREMLAEVREPGSRLDHTRLLSPRFIVLVAYMRHVLDDAETLDMLRDHAAALDDWDEAAARNAANPYGERLRAVLADIRALLDTYGEAQRENAQPKTDH